MRSYPTPTFTNFYHTMRRWLASRILRRDLSGEAHLHFLYRESMIDRPVFKITLVIVKRKGKTLFTYLTEVFTLKYREVGFLVSL